MFILIPADREPGDAARIAQLNLRFYGPLDAALNLANTYTNCLRECGFVPREACRCKLLHSERGVAMTAFGDDFAAWGTTGDLHWLRRQFESKFEVATSVLGPEKGEFEKSAS